MKKSNELKLERTAKLDAQRSIVALAKTENREITPEEEGRFDALQGEIESLDRSVERAEKFEANELRSVGQKAPVKEGGEGNGDQPKTEKRAYSLLRHLRMGFEGTPLDGPELEMNNRAIAESRAAGVKIPEGANIHIPASVLRGDGLTVSEDGGAYGGALVQDQAPRLQAQFTPKLFLQELGATRLSNLSGGDLPLPVAGAAQYSWLAETERIPEQKFPISGKVLSPKRVGARIPISKRLLMQSSIDAERMVFDILRKGYENIVQVAAINGSGTGNQPLGILNTPGIYSATHTAGPITRPMTLELQAALEGEDATEDSLGFLVHPKVKFALMGTPIDAGSGRFLMENKMVNGEKVVSSSLVPDLAGQRPVIYGDWSQLFIGEWGSLSLVINPWSKLDSGEIEVIANAYVDVVLAQPKAFAVDKFITAG